MAARPARRPGFLSRLHPPHTHARPLHTTRAQHLTPDPLQTPSAVPSGQISPFSIYTTTLPPTPGQLTHATNFFARSRRTFLLSTPHFKTLPPSPLPEVAFVGRSNVGKSSMLNAVLGGDGGRGGSGSVGGGGGRASLARESRHAKRTRQLCAFGVGDVRVVVDGEGGAGGQHEEGAPRERRFERWEAKGPSVVLLDTPGYGEKTPVEWGRQMIKYLRSRKQLRRTFVLVDIEHGLKETDKMMLRLLRSDAVPHQLIISKIDKILLPKATHRANPTLHRLDKLTERMTALVADAKEHGGPSLLRDPLGCCTQIAYPKGNGALMGVQDIRAAVLAAAGLSSDPSGSFNRRPEIAMQDLQIEGEAASAIV